MFPRASLFLGSLRLSPLALGVSVSVAFHAGLFTALHFTHRSLRTSPPTEPHLLTFSIGEPAIPAIPEQPTYQEPNLKDLPIIIRKQTTPVRGLPSPRLPAPFRTTSLTPPPAALPVPRQNIAKPTPPASSTPPPTRLAQPNTPLNLSSPVDSTPTLPIPETESSPERSGLNNGVVAIEVPAPVYPRSCRRRGHEGIVKIQVCVDEQGRVKQARILNSGGCPLLDKAALKAATKGRYQPAIKDGQPVDAHLVIPFRFILK